MVRKKLDPRIRDVIENGATSGHRSLFVIVGEKSRDQVVVLYQMLCKSASSRPSVLWCYKKELGFTTHRKKRMNELKKKIRSGQAEINDDDPFERFISSTQIRYTYYSETKNILGNTYGMLILQDFEAITPNILARTIETVEGGGAVVFLLHSVNSLRQLYSIAMDVHSRYRTESHQSIVYRFNERFILSLSDCCNFMALTDELDVLPLSSNVQNVAALPLAFKHEKPEREKQLSGLFTEMSDVKPIGPILKICKTLCQAKAVLQLLDLITERPLRTTVSITAARGRGKSAALGLAIAGAIGLNFTNIFVTSPSPENLKALFDFVIKGFAVMGLKEHVDFELTYSTHDEKKCINGLNVFRNHRQSIQYINPTESSKLSQAELLIIDEAAAIPLPLVTQLLVGNHLSFLSSTVNGYEGTGRSLSLKLLQQLREQSANNESLSQTALKRSLHEITLEESIRYSDGDPVEKWLYKLLCLEATNANYKVTGVPPPERCELYYVNRDTLFSYHKVSEQFLSRIMSIFVSAHYKNSPDDLQMLSDAPAHHLFVLLSPLKQSHAAVPEVLAAVQICMEGQLSNENVKKGREMGRRAAGDMIPWTLSQYFLDTEFPRLCGSRIIRLAVHPDLHGMGYGSRVVQLLQDYYTGAMPYTSNDLPQNDHHFHMLHDNDADDIESLPRKNLPPLMQKLTERSAEQLDYIGVSYGLNVELLKFWKRNGFVLTYIRQTSNELTGDYSCIMLKELKNSLHDKREDWLYNYFNEFRRRFISLLSFEFAKFSPHLALSVMQGMCAITPKRELPKKTLEVVFSKNDLMRLSQYAHNMLDQYLITDLLPTIATLYFNGQLGDSVELNIIQGAALLAMGLQRKTLASASSELSVPPSQLMTMVNKAIRRISEYCDTVCSSTIVFPEVDAGETPSSLLAEFKEELLKQKKKISKFKKRRLL